MEATEIITVQQAKDWLNSEETDAVITRLISGAINWVEEYTGHSLVSKEKVIQLPCSGHPISDYPFRIVFVKNTQGDTLQYSTKLGVYDVYVHAAPGALVNIVTGYENLYEVPPILIEGAYKMLTYLHENRDVYTLTAPTDLKVMLAKSRRNLV